MSGSGGKKLALMVAGPTCSGKSALALDVARAVGGSVINADSMQVYAELRVLTARPGAAEEALVPHVLYGIRPAALAGTVAWWRGEALAAMQAAHDAGRVPILCGGTGMYLAALSRGLADIPEPGPEARQEARALLAAEGPAALHVRLTQADPATAAMLRPSDSQRLARAWEVWRGTGTGLAAWQAASASPSGGNATACGWALRAVVLDPPRQDLRAAIAARFAAMLQGGAIDEVRALLAQELDPALPAMRAHGVPELAAHLRGETSLDEAGSRAVAATSRYTRRQATWFRHQPLVTADNNPAQAATHRLVTRYQPKEKLSQCIDPALWNFVFKTVDQMPCNG